MAVRTDYFDDILNAEVNTRRKYNLIQNDDGTVSLEDVTAYTQNGTALSAADLIAIAEAINNNENSIYENLKIYTRATSANFENSTIADFVKTIDSFPMRVAIGKFKLPASFSPSGTTSWYTGYVVFQNAVGSGADVGGKAVLERNSELYLGRINGTSDDTYSASWAWLPITNLGTKSLAASRALAIDSGGKVAVSNTTSLELSYLSGVTSKVQTQLDSKLPKSGGTMTGAINMGAKAINNASGVGFSGLGSITNSAQQVMQFMASDESAYKEILGVTDGTWARCPGTSGNLTLGTANHKYGQIYSTSSTISSSDKNIKKDIKALTEQHLKFFRMLQPVSFAFIDGTSGRTHVGFISQDVEEAMTACGLTDLDFAGFCKDQKRESVKKTRKEEREVEVPKEVEVERVDEETGEVYTTTEIVSEMQTIEEEVEYYEDVPIEGEYIYSLRYEEFIAIITYAVQRLYNEMELLKIDVELLKANMGMV